MTLNSKFKAALYAVAVLNTATGIDAVQSCKTGHHSYSLNAYQGTLDIARKAGGFNGSLAAQFVAYPLMVIALPGLMTGAAIGERLNAPQNKR